MGKIIHGIQQVGVGVKNAEEAMLWYAQFLGADIKIFDDSSEAKEMAPYMGGDAQHKRAVMLMNLEGGSGYEIWQYTSKEPVGSKKGLKYGDFGINVTFIKSREIEKSFKELKSKSVNIVSGIISEPNGEEVFYFKDPYGNLYKVKQANDWFKNSGANLGGVNGCAIGVSDIESSLILYKDVLGYDEVLYDQKGSFDDFTVIGEVGEFRRVLLKHKEERKGGFSPLFGSSQIELIQRLDNKAVSTFKDRNWGDLGFIHLCFDVKNIKALMEECAGKGYGFKVISPDSFDMGGTKSKWGYIEDNDGNLIEFVETYQLPLGLGIKLDLKNKPPYKPVPNWLIKSLRFKRIKV